MTDEERVDVEKQVQEVGQIIGAALDSSMGEEALFCLIVTREPSFSTYISNAERSDMVQLLRETASRVERNMDSAPGAHLRDEQPKVRFTGEILRGKDYKMPEGMASVGIRVDGKRCGVLVLDDGVADQFIDLLYHEQPTN